MNVISLNSRPLTFGKNSSGNVTGRLTFISAGEIKTIDIEVPA